MVFVRLLALLIAIGLAALVGNASSTGYGAGFFFLALIFVLSLCLYMLPSYEAVLNTHPDIYPIVLLNVFLGWTLLGWVGALVWAHKRPEEMAAASAKPPQSPRPYAEDKIASLERLVALREKGAFTIEEFEAQKRALL